jgi:S-adenosylmethionine:tRNA ribosyltransferase-isomerase
VVTTALYEPPLHFTLDAQHEAHEPPEVRGLGRDDVRLMVSRGADDPIDANFREFAGFLDPGDVLVVNTSATIPAAFAASLPDRAPVRVHYSGSLPGGLALVEVRAIDGSSTSPLVLCDPVTVLLAGGGVAHLLARFEASRRLWIATLALDADVLEYAARYGTPIRYRHVEREWPLETYQTIFSKVPGSSEMPSASRPFSHRMVTELVNRAVTVVPVVLHSGVSSLEGSERPYPERFQVSSTTAQIVNNARSRGNRVIATGTTVVRALGAVTDPRGFVRAGEGWTEIVVTKDTPVRSVDGLLTGWHEPESSHLLMLESIMSAGVLQRAYDHAVDQGYLWHEFGDTHLLLSDRERS